jgi:hypothetical protein
VAMSAFASSPSLTMWSRITARRISDASEAG